MQHIPYTYIIGWADLDKWYYGVRYSQNCTPDDLWNPYRTSSKYVKRFIEEYGEPDIISIRQIFNTSEDARMWEHKVLRRLKAAKSERWLNQTDNISINTELNIGRKATDKTRLKMSNSRKGELNPMYGSSRKGHNKGFIHSEETKQKISISKTGGKVSEETKLKMSNSRKGKPKSEETKQKMSEAAKIRGNSLNGHTHSEETKLKMSLAGKGKPKSEEMKNKLRGQKRSEETKRKISEARKRNRLMR